MSSNAAELLVELSRDPFKAWAFRENPGALLDGEGITPEEREILCSGNSGEILRYLGQDSLELFVFDDEKDKDKDDKDKDRDDDEDDDGPGGGGHPGDGGGRGPDEPSGPGRG